PPPTVQPIDDMTVFVGEFVTFVVTATDPDGEPLTMTADGLPDGATFTDNGDGTGTFRWSPGITQSGLFSVTFIASDGTGQGSTTVNFEVTGQALVLPLVLRP